MTTQRRLAVSYSRFSDPKQAKGDSEDRQERMFRTFCRRHNLTPSGEAFVDRGRSGYTDEHRKKGHLGRLVAVAKDRRFEPGTVIVVEAWDRLGRLRPDKMTELVAELVRLGLGIGVCRLDDIFTEDDFGTHKWTVLSTFIMLAFQESKQKADRVADSWGKRREKARQSGALLTGRVPAWLKVVNGQLVPLPERVATLRRIFQLAADCYGRARIIRTLIDEGREPFGDSGKWTRPYVAKILNNRTALGELQPRLENGKAEGEVIRGYYPAVITEEEYALARAGQDRRRGKGGRRDRRYVNVFQSVLRHARDGEPFVLTNRGTAKQPQLVLVNAAGHAGRAQTCTFPYPVLEESVLRLLPEINLADVLPKEKESPSAADVLRAQLANVRRDVAGLKEDLRGGYSKALADVLRQKEAEEEQVATQLQEELARTVKPAARAWQEVPELARLVAEGGDPARLKFRAVLRRVVEEAWLLTVACRPRRFGTRRQKTGGGWRLAALQLFFHGGARRDYLVLYKPAGHNRTRGWWARSLAEVVKPGELDLRKPAHAQQLEKLLLKHMEELVALAAVQ
jgi:DNA invertase Pin-like site-specific DNA recombinase